VAAGASPIARRSERLSATIPVTLLVGSHGKKTAHDALTVDLSPRGARVRPTVVLTPGQTLEFLPKEGPSYSVPTRVVWVGAAQSKRVGQAGLEFLIPLPTPV